MFCSNCGEKLASGSKFCPKCGNKALVDENSQADTDDFDDDDEEEGDDDDDDDGDAEDGVENKGVIVYKDWKLLLTMPLVIFGLPIWAIYNIYEEIAVFNTGVHGNDILLLVVCCIFSMILGVWHKYLRGGIIMDLDERVISFPRVTLLPFVRARRRKIGFGEITGITATDEAKVENEPGGFKLMRTYKFAIHGKFGSKTISFRNREKRDQFYSLLSVHGNFS